MTCQPTKANMGTVHVAIGGDTRLQYVPFARSEDKLVKFKVSFLEVKITNL